MIALTTAASQFTASPPTSTTPPAALSGQAAGSPELKQAFGDFVGQTFFGQLISSMRKTVEKPAYFHGGRAEEVFQGQLDQMLSEKISASSADQFANPMFDLFQLQRR